MSDAPVTIPQHVYLQVEAIFPELLDDADGLAQVSRRMGQQLAHALRVDRMTPCSAASVELVVDPAITELQPRKWWEWLLRRPQRRIQVSPEIHKLVAQIRAIPQAVAGGE